MTEIEKATAKLAVKEAVREMWRTDLDRARTGLAGADAEVADARTALAEAKEAVR